MLKRKISNLIQRFADTKKTVAGAESCTAGLVSSLIAGIPGASRVFWGSYICYTPDAKQRMLGVGEDILGKYGVVSSETACAMAEGALKNSGADYAFSVTGLAGPSGDGSDNPVGTVWIALAQSGEKTHSLYFHFTGSRNRVQRKAAVKILDELIKISTKFPVEMDNGNCEKR